VPGVSEHVAVFESASSDSDAATSHGGAASAGAEDRSVLATTAERLAAVLTGNTPSPLPAGQPPASGPGVRVSVATAEGGEGGGPGENGEDGSDSSTSSASGPDDQGSAGETTSPGQAEPEPDPDPTQTLVTALQEVTDDLTAWVGQTVGEVAVIAGDTLNAVVEPVAELIEPVDSVVEDLTGLSVTETLEDVTNLLPGSDGTPVPLGQTVEDIVEPVEDLLEDPLAPVEDLLEDPLAPVEDLTGPLLGPLLPGDTPAPPSVTPQPGATPTPEPTATPEEGLCLLGLLLC
jgi:hypothetical protein